MAYNNNNNFNNVNNGNGNNSDNFMDLSYKIYSNLYGSFRMTPTFGAKNGPSLLIQMAKAINPGTDNTPCDWQNSMFFALDVEECWQVTQFAKAAAQGNYGEGVKFFHKNTNSKKTFNIKHNDKGGNSFYVTISAGQNNYISFNLYNGSWYEFVSTCKFMCDNAIGIRAQLGEIARIMANKSDFNKCANGGGSYKQNNGGNNNYQPQNNGNGNGNNNYQPRQFNAPSAPAPVPPQVPQQQQMSFDDSGLDI